MAATRQLSVQRLIQNRAAVIESAKRRAKDSERALRLAADLSRSDGSETLMPRLMRSHGSRLSGLVRRLCADWVTTALQ